MSRSLVGSPMSIPVTANVFDEKNMADKVFIVHRHLKSMAALGRIFQLGDLYNYHQDLIINDCLVWETAALTSNTQAQEKWELRISCGHGSDNYDNKWENMSLDQHLQVSILAGIIDNFHGASNYVFDRSDSSLTTQTFVCRAKLREQHLDLQALASEKILLPVDAIEKEQATHVIVGIFYGAEAYCVLTDGQETNDSGKQVKEKLATFWKTSLQQSLDLVEFKELFDKEEKLMLNKLKCRLYADLHPEAVRECGVFEAYKQCLNLIDHVQNLNLDINKSVPVTVQLCPLEIILGSKKKMEKVYYDVDVDIVSRYCRISNKLEEIRTRVDALRASVLKDNGSRLLDFGEAIAKYQDILRISLKNSVVKSRLTAVDDVKSVVEIAENHSLFKPSKLKRWLFYEEAEFQLTGRLTADLNGIAVLADEEELKSTKPTKGKKFAVVLRVPMLNLDSNWILNALKTYVRSNTNLIDDPDEEGDFDNDGDTTEEEEEASGIPYHTVKVREQQARDKIRELVDFVKINKQLFCSQQVVYFVMLSDYEMKNLNTSRPQKSKCHYTVYASKLFENSSSWNYSHTLSHLPGPPTDLQIQHPADESPIKKAKTDLSTFIVQWNYETIRFPCLFTVRYRLKGSDGWTTGRTAVSLKKTVTINCEAGKALEIKVAAMTYIGQSEFSDILDTETFVHPESSMESSATIRKQPQRSDGQSVPMVTIPSSSSLIMLESSPKVQLPLGLKIGFVTQTTAEITWTSTVDSVLYYLRYWPKGEDPSTAKFLVMSSNETSFLLKGLKPETSYSVNLSVATEPETVEFQTLAEGVRFAEMLVSHCEKMKYRDGMEVYTVPLTKTTPTGIKIERYAFGKHNKAKEPGTRTILLVGASGCGKMSVINGMLNYIFQVDWIDPFRFQLDQTEGDGINVYEIHHYEGFNIDYSLTIIDTPSYGDNAHKNREITEKIRQFFGDNGGTQELDMIGLVVNSSLPKFTATEEVIYESVVSIFGDEIKENVRYFTTSTNNNKDPPLVQNFKGIGFPAKFETTQDHQFPSFQFFNSAFFSRNRNSVHPRQETIGCKSLNDINLNTTCNFHHFLWSVAIENLFSLFSELNSIGVKSLSSIQNLLKEKMRLESTVEALESLIKVDLVKMEELLAVQYIVSNQKVEMDAGVNLMFQIKVTRTKKVELPFGESATNCTICNITCHHSCGCLNQVEQCDVMDHSMPIADRHCQVCPGHCLWSSHVRQPFQWVFVQQTRTTSTDAVKGHYEAKLKRKLTADEVLKELDLDAELNEKTTLDRLLTTIVNCKGRLDVIAKRKNRGSPLRYINQLIADEKKGGRSELRIKCLKRIRLLSVIHLLNSI